MTSLISQSKNQIDVNILQTIYESLSADDEKLDGL